MKNSNDKYSEIKMDEIISFCKEKGFVFQSSEIYGGQAGLYDFGPNGVELLNNIKKNWWKENIQKKKDYFGLDSAIFKDPQVWEASGHTSRFSDPMAKCKCNIRIRVDKELEKLGVLADENMSDEEINKLFSENKDKISCKKCGKKDFSEAESFNLLVRSNLGDFTSSENYKPVYLPGEACQGIYLNYKNIVNSMYPKIPFGIGQIGKAFRNEISPRNFLFRTREFEQADTQFFVRPGENKEAYEKIKSDRWEWYKNLGISEKNLKWSRHENLVFYAKDAWDIKYNFPTYGFDEIEGVHDRSDYDLSVHQKHSGTDLRFNEDGNKFIPWVLEASMGLGRVFLAVLCEAYQSEHLKDGTERKILKLNKNLAPVKIAIMPLMKKDDLVKGAMEIFGILSESFETTYSDISSIGKRYRKQDEIGTPFCITFDYESKEDMSVTIRDRDTMKQERIKIENLENYFFKKFKE